MRGHEAVQGHASLADYVRASIGWRENASKVESALFIPGADSSPEDVTAFFTKLGRPGAPADYQLPDMPDGFEWDNETVEWAKKTMHEGGAWPGLFQHVVKAYAQFQAEKQQRTDTQRSTRDQEMLDNLKKTLGGEYEATVNYGRQLFSQYGDESLRSWAEETKAYELPAFVAFAGRIKRAMSQDAITTPGGGGLPPTPPAGEGSAYDHPTSVAARNRAAQTRPGVRAAPGIPRT